MISELIENLEEEEEMKMNFKPSDKGGFKMIKEFLNEFFKDHKLLNKDLVGKESIRGKWPI